MSPAAPLRFGLIGTGEAARNLATGLRLVPDAELRYVASRSWTNAWNFARAYGATAPAAGRPRFEEVLGFSDVDAVIIATPDRLHAAQAIAAAEAGKHVFVEKPMATSREDALAIVDACERARVTLGVGYHQRWNPWHRKVREGILPGRDFGPIRHARFRWTKSVEKADDWRTGELGRWWSLAAYGTHVLDLATWMLEPRCGEVTSLRAVFTRGRLQAKADESAQVVMRFADGAIAEIFVSMVHRRERLIELEGDRGTIVLRDTLGAGPGYLEGPDGARTHADDRNPHAAELADFIDAVRAGRSPEVGGRSGCRNVELLEEAEASDGWQKEAP